MLILPFLLAACGVDDRELLFSGPLKPLAGTCDPPTTAALNLHHKAIVFAPDTGTLVLHGNIDPSGQVTAELTLQGIDREPYRLTLQATRQGSTIEGTYTTPRCRYAVTLKQSED